MIAQAQTQVVQAQTTGSIIGTTLLFLGISALVAGVKYPLQTSACRLHWLSSSKVRAKARLLTKAMLSFHA
jgi:Ca2+/H+ antiporter